MCCPRGEKSRYVEMWYAVMLRIREMTLSADVAVSWSTLGEIIRRIRSGFMSRSECPELYHPTGSIQ